MELKDFLENKARDAELLSLREKPDERYDVRLSSYKRLQTKVEWLAALLDDLYEVEEKEDEVCLKAKSRGPQS